MVIRAPIQRANVRKEKMRKKEDLKNLAIMSGEVSCSVESVDENSNNSQERSEEIGE